MKKNLIIIVLLLVLTPLFAQLEFSLPRWELGEILPESSYQNELIIQNISERTIEINLLPDCSCLAISENRLILEPGQTGVIQLEYDSTGQAGEQRKHLIIRSDHPDMQKLLLPIQGNVISTEESQEEPSELDLEHPDYDVKLLYYYSPGCRGCQEFLEEEIPRLQDELGLIIAVESRNILESQIFEELELLLRDRGIPMEGVPLLVGQDFILQGEDPIRANLEDALRSRLSGDPRDNTGDVLPNLAFFPVLFAGLLDGINPCAFTTIMFLLSVLHAFGRKRREIFVIGGAFTLAVFISYLAMGAGMFRLLRLAGSFPMIRDSLGWILACAMVVLAGLSFYDSWLCKKGRAKDMKLQLPDLLKKRMRKSIKDYARSSALVGGALLLGVLVSLFELACTGQVYLPMLAWMIQSGQGSRSWGYLVVYNLGFILPLLLVFLSLWWGIGSQKIVEIYQKHLAGVKLALGLFFILMAMLLLLIY